MISNRLKMVAGLLVFAAILAFSSAGIVEFEQKAITDETHLLLDLLSESVVPERYKSEEFFKKWGNFKDRVTAFKWSDCGGSAIKVTALSDTPDPMVLPGNIKIGATATFNATLDNLQANLTIWKKVGSTFVKIPCIGDFGSCTYDTFCDILSGVDCPDAITKSGLGCTCPFKPNTYTLPPTVFDASSLYFPGGDYHAMGELNMSGKKVACIDIYLSIKTAG